MTITKVIHDASAQATVYRALLRVKAGTTCLMLTGWKMKKAAASVFSAWHRRHTSISFSSCATDQRHARFPSSSRKRACSMGGNMATNQAQIADTMGEP